MINHISANNDHQTMPRVGLLIFLTCPTIVCKWAKQNSRFPGTGLSTEVKRTVRYTPNDEDVSLLEQIAADKGRFSEESDHTLYGSANHVETLRRNSTYKRTNSKHDFTSCFDTKHNQTQLLATAYLGNELVLFANWQWCDWHNVDDSNVHYLMERCNDVKIL
jgi:hypothetical protein